MSNGDPGSFLTSSVTSGVAAVAGGVGKGALSGGFEGALLGASVGSIFPGVGTLAGGVAGAGLGAIFGSLTGTSKALKDTWDKLIVTSRGLISTFAKYSPLLTAQQERWRHLDMQIGTVWAKTIAPTLKHITDVGIEIKQRWTRLKITVFKSWEGVVNKLISGFGALVKIALSLTEFFEKLKASIMKLLGIEPPLQKPTAEAPQWGDGSTVEYGRSRSGRFGGEALSRGKFVPDNISLGQNYGKLEFDWAKRLNPIKAPLSSPLTQQLFPLVSLVKQILNIMQRIFGKKAPPMSPEDAVIASKWLSSPTTEAEREAARARIHKKFGTTPKEKSEPTSFLGGSILPGAAGMVTSAISMAVLTSPFPAARDEPVKYRWWQGKMKRRHALEAQRRADREMLAKREPKERKPEDEARYQLHLRELRESAEVQREELKKFRGVRRGPLEARKDQFERDEEALITKEEYDRRLDQTETETETEVESESKPETSASREYARAATSVAEGNIIMQVLDSNQLLEMLSFSWDEVRNVLRQQQAEYTLLKYRMQTEGTYL